MQEKAVVVSEPAAELNARKRQCVKRSATQWAKLIEAQRQSNGRGVLPAAKNRQSRVLVLAQASGEGYQVAVRRNARASVTCGDDRGTGRRAHRSECGCMRVRLEGMAAARVVEAIVASIGRGA